MEVAAGLGVDETDHILVRHELNGSLRIIERLLAVRVEEPIIVCVFVMVAGNLLLLRALRIGLDVGMK